MLTKRHTVLSINPGTKYLGIAVFRNGDLRDWAVKSLPGKWSANKMMRIQTILSDLIFRYNPGVIALKGLHPSGSSDNLDKIVCEIHEIAWRKGIDVREYSIENIERYHSSERRINKRELAEMLTDEYPALFHELERELDKKKIRLKNYHSRMFEAVALGAACFREMDGPQV